MTPVEAQALIRQIHRDAERIAAALRDAYDARSLAEFERACWRIINKQHAERNGTPAL